MKNRWLIRGTFILTICLLLFSRSQADVDSELKSIRYTQKEDRLEVTIEVSGDFSFDTFSLLGPRRLVLDLSPVQNIKASPVININACGVIRIRCGQFKPEVARVVFDLADQVPSHKISRTSIGLQILFWQEEQTAAEKVVPEVREEIPPAAKKPEEKIAGKPGVVPILQPPLPAAGPSPRLGTLLRLQGGLSLFPGSILTTQQDLLLYGETGSLSEKYKPSFNLVFGLGLGKFIKMKEKQAKIGADFFLWSLSNKGVFEAAIPHPFLPNTPRTLPFEEKLSNSLFQITAFFSYPLINNENFTLWVGPAVGYAFGKLTSLEDFSVEDNPPYSSNDLILSSTTLIEESISDFIFEGRIEINYLLSPRTSFFALTSLSYFNPKVPNLAKRAKFLQIPFCLGLEFRL